MILHNVSRCVPGVGCKLEILSPEDAAAFQQASATAAAAGASGQGDTRPLKTAGKYVYLLNAFKAPLRPSQVGFGLRLQLGRVFMPIQHRPQDYAANVSRSPALPTLEVL